MEVLRLRSFAGPNLYSHRPSVVLRVDCRDAPKASSRSGHELHSLLNELLPQVANTSGMRVADAPDSEAATLVKEVALRLIALAGFDGCGGIVRAAGGEGLYEIAVESSSDAATRYLLDVAVKIAENLMSSDSITSERLAVSEYVEEAMKIALKSDLGPSTQAIVAAAEARAIPWSREADNSSSIQFGYGRNLRRIRAAMTDKTPVMADMLAGNKHACKKRLEKFSIPVPAGVVVQSIDGAIAAFREMTPPVVVKPRNGNQGKGISTGLVSEEEIYEAFEAARDYGPQVLLEEELLGRNYRALLVDAHLVAASERLAPVLIGDGIRTIAELVKIENLNPLRGDGHEKALSKIRLSTACVYHLRRNGIDVSHILKEGATLVLAGINNLSSGATAVDVTDQVHPKIKTICERAARVTGLDICGIDLITPDISEPMPAVRAGIIEINSVPGLRMHAYPSAGQRRDVGRSIVEMLYPDGAESRIPIVAITGTNGKTTVTRLTSHILTGTGKNVGTATTDGILLNGESLVSGDMTGPASARSILDDKGIDIAVLETARGGILRRGLGWDWADVAVVTNITEDHIGQDGIESVKDLVEIKSLVAERVRENGTLILNADDPESAALAHRPLVARSKKEIVYFALSADHPILKRHLEHGGTGYFTVDNQIVEARDGLHLNIAEIQLIPITMSGSAAFQIQNALASAAVGRALGLSAEKIAEGFYSFDANRHNPGRCNMYKVRDGHVLIDYGHNPKAVEAICSMTARWSGKTVTGIISFPGDRSDDVIESAGRIAATGFDRIIVKGDVNLRGRKSGEVAEMLCRLVRESDPERECSIVLEAESAFENAVSEIKKDEVIVFFYEKLPPVLATLVKYGAEPVSSVC